MWKGLEQKTPKQKHTPVTIEENAKLLDFNLPNKIYSSKNIYLLYQKNNIFQVLNLNVAFFVVLKGKLCP